MEYFLRVADIGLDLMDYGWPSRIQDGLDDSRGNEWEMEGENHAICDGHEMTDIEKETAESIKSVK
jgi:hypothetical protein